MVEIHTAPGSGPSGSGPNPTEIKQGRWCGGPEGGYMRLVDADAVIRMIDIMAETVYESAGAFVAGLNKAGKIIDSMTIFIPEQGMADGGLSVRLKNPPANPGTERNYGTGGEIIDL
jgi:hypothetical protein